MMSGMAVFMVAVGGTSLICYLLMNRVQNRRTRRESAGDGAYSRHWRQRQFQLKRLELVFLERQRKLFVP